MMRFILFCMALVALSICATTAAFMMDGIKEKRLEITAREVDPAKEEVAVIEPAVEDQTDDMAAAALNNIETTAGDVTADQETNSGFGPSFTNEAPAALSEGKSYMPAVQPEIDGAVTSIAE